jgi:polysaccharide biosynthesis transport protein
VAAQQEYPSNYGMAPPTHEHASLFSVLRTRWLIVVVAILLAGGAAAAFAFLTRNTYESTAKIVFSQAISNELNAIGLLPSSVDADNLAQSNVDLVGSWRVAEATSEELRGRGIDMSSREVHDDVTAARGRESDTVDVTASSTSAQRAALLATVYADNADRIAEADDRERALRGVESLQRQFEALPENLQNAGVGPGSRLRADIEQMQLLADVGSGRARVVQDGFVPTSKSGNPIQTILLGVLFGVVLGVGLALLREQSDRRLRRTEQVTAAFDAPVLTTVPRNRAIKRNKPFADLPPEVSEAFRMLQVNLRFAREEPVRRVMVTSSRTGEGKTTVSWNLAAAAAAGGLSVALIEADLRRPSLAQRYGLEPHPGLAEALKGELSISAALQTLLPLGDGSTPVGHPRPLHVIVAGQPALNPSALMQSSMMARVLDVVARDHDLMIVDTPPIPHVADAISLLRHVDGVVVVASVNSTRGPEAARLRDQLQGMDATVLGVVANGGSALSGYAAYAPSGHDGARDSNGHPGTPILVRDSEL